MMAIEVSDCLSLVGKMVPNSFEETVPNTGSPALLILLANSRRASLGRNLGKVECAGKAFPRFQRPQTNSPAVSLLMIEDSHSGRPGYPFASAYLRCRRRG